MANVSVNATSRTETGKGAARKMRAQGLMPAVIYRAGQPATSVSIDPNELENAFRRSGNRNTLVDLGVEGKSFTCLVKKTQRDPVTSNLIHVDFYEVDANESVLVKVPIQPTGKAAGVVAGGRLRVIVRDLMIRCKPGDIPATVDVDVTPLNVGDFIRVSAVPAPSGTEIVSANDFNVFTVVGKRGAAEEELEVAGDAAAEGEGAEGDAEEGGE